MRKEILDSTSDKIGVPETAQDTFFVASRLTKLTQVGAVRMQIKILDGFQQSLLLSLMNKPSLHTRRNFYIYDTSPLRGLALKGLSLSDRCAEVI